MKFRLSYSYVYGIIALIKDDIDRVHERAQNLYVPSAQEGWRKKVSDSLQDYYVLALQTEAEHSIDVDAIRRSLEVIKVLDETQLAYIKSVEVPELSESAQFVKKMVMKQIDDIADTPFVEKKSRTKLSAKPSTKEPELHGGDIPW